MNKKDNKALNDQLKLVNKDIKKVNDNLIKALMTVGIEYIDLYTYINLLDNLTTRKNKLQYLIAVNIE